MNAGTIPRVSFFGLSVDLFTQEALTGRLISLVTGKTKAVIANHNQHSVFLSLKMREVRDFFARAHSIHADGMGVVLIGKLLGAPIKGEHRITYMDWIRPVLHEAEQRKWRIFYIGSSIGALSAGLGFVRAHYPSIVIQGHHGYFDFDGIECENILQEIGVFQPDVLFVGMGMPRQELWIRRFFDRLPATVVLPCGAVIDYLSGTIPTPPRWAGRLGLEWIFRFVAEPQRLWKRYFLEPLYILWRMVVLIAKHPFSFRASSSGS